MRFRAGEIGVLGALSLAVALGGCADVDANKDAWFSKPFEFTGRKSGYTFSDLQESKDRRRPITANDLVAANGSCPPPAAPQAAVPAAANQTPPAPPDAGALLGGGISLGMSECDVVFRAGAPSNVQIGNNPGSERNAVLTFNGGPRPGIYRFQAGSLIEIDQGQTPPAPPADQTAKKKPAPSAKSTSKQAAKE